MGFDIVLIEQFLEDAIETLFRDFQDVQQLGDRQSRPRLTKCKTR